MSSTDRTLSKINIFTNLTALKNHTETEIGDTELSIVGEIAVVVESYRNGTEWYRIWSDGWVEQGGLVGWATGNNWTTFTVTLLVPMADTNYTLLASGGNNGSPANASATITVKSTTGFSVKTTITGSAQLTAWAVNGMMAV